jgi:hypothetical protein
VLGVVLSGGPAWATCGDLDADTLARGRSEAEAAIEALDPDRLVAVVDALTADVRCVGEVLSTHDVAELFRVKGYAAFVEDRDAATQWFGAAKSLDPAYVIPPVLVSERHPMRRAYDQATASEGDELSLVPPLSGSLRVDGRPSDRAPAGRPYVLQHVDDDGSVKLTALVGPGEPVPVYEIKQPADKAPATLHVAVGTLGIQPTELELVGFAGVSGGVQLPLADPLVLSADLGIGWTPLSEPRMGRWGLEDEDVGLPFAYNPYGSLGLGTRLDAGAVDVTPGVALIGALGPFVRAGGLGTLAVSVPTDGPTVFADVRGGWADGPLTAVHLGLELGL